MNLHFVCAQKPCSFEKIDSIVYIALVSQKEVVESSDYSYFPNRVAFRIQFPFEYNSTMTPWDFFKLNGCDTIISRESYQRDSIYKLIELNSELNFNKAGYRIEVFSLKNVFRIDKIEEEYMILDSLNQEAIYAEKLFVHRKEKSSLPIYTIDIPFIYSVDGLIGDEKWDWLQNHISKFQ